MPQQIVETDTGSKIHNYGVFLFELASLQDSGAKSKKKFGEHLEEIEKRYGKLYMQFLKEVLNDEFGDWDSVIAKLKSIGSWANLGSSRRARRRRRRTRRSRR